MGLAQRLQFPCAAMPEEPSRARLLGIYPHRPEGFFFQRIRLPGGQIRVEQWIGLTALAARHTPDYPLHVTTRQDVELHGVRPEDVGVLQQGVAELGLSCAGACGDTVRNVTFCPSNGLRRDTWDVSALAEAIQSRVESISWITELPRKFKISLCGCHESCARPWINDLGLIANRDGTFRAVVAGSLGSKPGTGVVLEDSITVGQILPLVVALLRLFHAEGDRVRRHRARLRHVRERLGEAAFLDYVGKLFQEEQANGHDDAPRIWRVAEDTPLQAHLHLPLGDLECEAAIELGKAAEEASASLRIGFEHDLLLYGANPLTLGPPLRALSVLAPVVACPGSTWCAKGIVDSRDAARRMARGLPSRPRLSVAVSGCPNNCSQAAVASIGLVGRARRVGGRPVKGFQILAGGGEGRGPGLARELVPFVAADDVDEAVAWIVEEYRRAVDRDATTDFQGFLSKEFRRLADALDRRHGDTAREELAAASYCREEGQDQ